MSSATLELLGEVAAVAGQQLDAADVEPRPFEDRLPLEFVERGRDRVLVRDRPGAELRIVLRPAPFRRFGPTCHGRLLCFQARGDSERRRVPGRTRRYTLAPNERKCSILAPSFEWPGGGSVDIERAAPTSRALHDATCAAPWRRSRRTSTTPRAPTPMCVGTSPSTRCPRLCSRARHPDPGRSAPIRGELRRNASAPRRLTSRIALRRWPVAAHEDLMAAAVAQTGLDDFGDDSFREGLEILVRSLRHEARLNAARRGVPVSRGSWVTWRSACRSRTGTGGIPRSTTSRSRRR